MVIWLQNAVRSVRTIPPLLGPLPHGPWDCCGATGCRDSCWGRGGVFCGVQESGHFDIGFYDDLDHYAHKRKYLVRTAGGSHWQRVCWGRDSLEHQPVQHRVRHLSLFRRLMPTRSRQPGADLSLWALLCSSASRELHTVVIPHVSVARVCDRIPAAGHGDRGAAGRSEHRHIESLTFEETPSGMCNPTRHSQPKLKSASSATARIGFRTVHLES